MRKLFIGRLPDNTKQDDLDSYFGNFGDLTDVYIPTPFRGFGFVTFASSDVARSVLSQTQHTLKVFISFFLSNTFDGNIMHCENTDINI